MKKYKISMIDTRRNLRNFVEAACCSRSDARAEAQKLLSHYGYYMIESIVCVGYVD